MPPLYVYALTDCRVPAWIHAGRRIHSVRVHRLFAICEQRASPPPLDETELRSQYSVVVRIAETVPALLPVRFGSLVASAELEKIVRQREHIFGRALVRVRDSVQLTLRIAVPRVDLHQPASRPSGRDYLQQRLKARTPELPEAVAGILRRIGSLACEERRAVSTSGHLSVYHLVRRPDVGRYQQEFEKHSSSAMIMTGPQPPFAFVPDLWT